MGINATASFIDNVSRILIQVVTVFLGYGVAGLAGGFVAGMVVGLLDLLTILFQIQNMEALM
jgi:hypothetical protein